MAAQWKLARQRTLSVCSCQPRCAEVAITADVDLLWQHLRESMVRQSPAYDDILRKIPATSETLQVQLSHNTHAIGTVETHTRPQGSRSIALDWVDGLGTDILCIVLRFAGIAGTGSAAASCRALHRLTQQDEVWRAHLESLVPMNSTRTLQPARRCREWVDLRRLEMWYSQVLTLSEQASRCFSGACNGLDGLASVRRDAKESFVRAKLDDANRRLGALQYEDFREAQRIQSPPPELVLASWLLHALLHESAEDHDETAVLLWFQGLLPQIADKRGAQAQAQVGAFLSQFFDYNAEQAPHQNLLQAEAMLPGVCLRRLDESIQKLVHDGYPKFGGGGCGPGKVLRAARVASAVIRWVAATVQTELACRRAAPLAELGRELECACRVATQCANVATLSLGAMHDTA